MSGTQWLVEATGCDPARLRDRDGLAAMFDEIVHDLSLHVVGTPAWHVFPGPGGVTGVYLLAESHLTVHTFPEHGSACLDLFCCRPRKPWDFARGMHKHLAASDVSVREVERSFADVVVAT